MATFVLSQGQQQADLQGGTGALQANGDSTSGHGYNVGDVKIYAGAVPANANAAEATPLLIDWVLPNPAFAAPSAALPSAIAANAITSVNAVASGTATYGRMLANGDTGVLSTTQRRGQFDVGTSGASVNFNTLAISSGAACSLTSLTVTHG